MSSISSGKYKSLSRVWLWPHELYSPRNSPGQNIGVGSLSLLQGISPTQGLNPGLPHCRWLLYQLSRRGNLRILEWVAYPFSSKSSRPRNQTGVSCIAGRFFTNWAIREAPPQFRKKSQLYLTKVPRVSDLIFRRWNSSYQLGSTPTRRPWGRISFKTHSIRWQNLGPPGSRSEVPISLLAVRQGPLFFWSPLMFLFTRSLQHETSDGAQVLLMVPLLTPVREHVPYILMSTILRLFKKNNLAVVLRPYSMQASVIVAHGLSCSTARGIFPHQGSNPCFLHWELDSYPPCHLGSPRSDCNYFCKISSQQNLK